MLLITYNSVNNIPSAVEEPRPEFIAGRNYSPLTENDRQMS
jgi:hypothetical protein